MATWQFDVHLVPRLAFVTQRDRSLVDFDSGVNDFSFAWGGFVTSDSLVSALSQLLPRTDSWNPDMDTWGRAESHRIEILRDRSTILDIRVRIDLSSAPEAFLQQIMNVAVAHNLIMIDDKCEIVEPVEDSVYNAIKRSDAYKFVVDSRSFLNNLHKKAMMG